MARVREKKIKVKIRCQRCNQSYTVSEWHRSSSTVSGNFSHRLPYVRNINIKCPGCGYNQNVNRCTRTMITEGRELDGYYVTT